jgi:hypothetical protein
MLNIFSEGSHFAHMSDQIVYSIDNLFKSLFITVLSSLADI